MDLRSKKEFVTKITAEAVFSVRYGLEIKEAAEKKKSSMLHADLLLRYTENL